MKPTLIAGVSVEYERAMAAYDSGNYDRAVQLLQPVAESHVRAQEILGMMYWYGPRLYGDKVPRKPDQAIEILDRAADSGSQFAKQLLGIIDRRVVLLNSEGGSRG